MAMDHLAILILLTLASVISVWRIFRTRSARVAVAFGAVIASVGPLAYAVAKSNEWRKSAEERRELVRFLNTYNAAAERNGPPSEGQFPVETAYSNGETRVAWRDKSE